MLQVYCFKKEARQISTWCAKKERGDREEGKYLDAAGAKGRPERGWAPAKTFRYVFAHDVAPFLP